MGCTSSRERQTQTAEDFPCEAEIERSWEAQVSSIHDCIDVELSTTVGSNDSTAIGELKAINFDQGTSAFVDNALSNYNPCLGDSKTLQATPKIDTGKIRYLSRQGDRAITAAKSNASATTNYNASMAQKEGYSNDLRAGPQNFASIPETEETKKMVLVESLETNTDSYSGSIDSGYSNQTFQRSSSGSLKDCGLSRNFSTITRAQKEGYPIDLWAGPRNFASIPETEEAKKRVAVESFETATDSFSGSIDSGYSNLTFQRSSSGSLKDFGFSRNLSTHKRRVVKLKISVKTQGDLLLATEIDKAGKTIEFVAESESAGFEGHIYLHFPPYAVLGKETIFLEIIPETLISQYNSLCNRQKTILTPILHIDRKIDAPFLRGIDICLPLISGKSIEESPKLVDGVRFGGDRFSFEQTKFSPTGVCYDKVEKIVEKFQEYSHFSQCFMNHAVYMLFEQFKGQNFQIDVRKFKDDEEHRSYRCDEKRFFRMIVNPEVVDENVIDTKIEATIQDTATVVNFQEYRNVKDNTVFFTFPDVGNRVDNSNERVVKIVPTDTELSQIGIKFQFESLILQQKGIDGVVKIPVLSESKIKELTELWIMPSHGMLTEFVSSLGTKWSDFLSDYLKVEIRYLRDFISDDIISSLPPRKFNWSDEIEKQLTDEMTSRHKMRCNFSSKDHILPEILRIHQTSHQLRSAKAEIIECLEETGILNSPSDISPCLLLSSCQILAHALMYLPISKLKKAMYCAFHDRVFSITGRPDVEKFIFDRELPEGESVY